jgi:hypothetical protein
MDEKLGVIKGRYHGNMGVSSVSWFLLHINLASVMKKFVIYQSFCILIMFFPFFSLFELEKMS